MMNLEIYFDLETNTWRTEPRDHHVGRRMLSYTPLSEP
jgi:hypothetical protein